MRGRERSHEGYLLNERERWIEREREGDGERNGKINIESANLSLHEVIWSPTVAFDKLTAELHSVQQNKQFVFDLQCWFTLHSVISINEDFNETAYTVSHVI